MSSTPEQPRRPLRLPVDSPPPPPVSTAPSSDNPPNVATDGAEPAWRLRGPDGAIKGPFLASELRTLVDTGFLTADFEIAAPEEENWQNVTNHALWPQISVKKARWSVRGPQSATPPPLPTTPFPVQPAVESPHDRPISRKMVDYQEENARAEMAEAWSRVRWDRLARTTRAVREVVIFLFFVTLGDLAVSWVPGPPGVFHLTAALCVLTVSILYYAWKVFSD